MPKHINQSKLLFTSFLSVFLVILSSSLLIKKENTQEEVKGISTENTVVTNIQSEYIEEDIQEIYPIDICCENVCYHMQEEEILDITNNGEELDIVEYTDFLNDILIPFFKRHFAGYFTEENENGKFEYWGGDSIPDLTSISEDLSRNIEKSISGEEPDEVVIVRKNIAGTDGTYAEKYIEVDNSRQMLFVWMNGKVVKTILLSGPMYGFQVYGVFPIVDKGLDPVAPGGKYMPYWMAFHYSKSQDSWYGLHALIWWYDSNGNRVYESTSNIGSRESAGCIRMLLEDAKYLYENFDRGDYVLIHE